MLSSKAKYAIRAVALLAERGRSSGWMQMAEVAETEQIPQKFLEAILVELRGHGLAESRRGAQGGHRLLRNPADISIADIIRILDGPLALTPCASQTRFRPRLCENATGSFRKRIFFYLGVPHWSKSAFSRRKI
jgi:Rrf2 family protein